MTIRNLLPAVPHRAHCSCVVAVVLAAPARAAPPAPSSRSSPRPVDDPATGERYHIEASAGFWFPTADMSISSESLGIPGSTIDFKKDLGLTDQRFPELHLVLRPATKHKFRFQYIPIKYDQSGDADARHRLQRPALPRRRCRSTRRSTGRPTASATNTTSSSKDRGFGGFILDFKYTDVDGDAGQPAVRTEFAHARAPIPAIGGIVRVYVVPNISITGEVTGHVKLAPEEHRSRTTTAHYADVDVYGTVNFTNNIGAQVGYRSFDVGYLVNTDTGSFTLKGMYFGVVAILNQKMPVTCNCVPASNATRRHELREPAVGFEQRLVLLAEAEPQLRPALRRRSCRSCCPARPPRPRPSPDTARTRHRR